MKLHILSDLHTEFGEFKPPETAADVVVLAGDTCVGVHGLHWAGSHFTSKPVIYVPGNHEFYRHDISLIDELKAQAQPNIHVLNNDSIEIGGVRFLGCVLWTDFAYFGVAKQHYAQQQASHSMNDFALIRQNGRPFTPEDSVVLHEESREWLKAMLARPFDGKTIIVTHHLPSSRSVPPQFADSMLTPAYVSNLEELMDGSRVALWVHGHAHEAFDYELNGTRVLCNPRGYCNYELVDEFKPDFVVEI